MSEIWKDIPGHENSYRVSNMGNVCSVDRIDHTGRRRKSVSLKPTITYKGYLTVHTCLYGKSRSWFVHKLVLMTFVGPCPDNNQINHKNGDRKDNRLTNLEYVTPHENSMHAFKYGRRRSNLTGDKHWSAKLVANEIKAIRLLYGSGKYTQIDLADIFHVGQGHIGKIINREKWTHI